MKIDECQRLTVTFVTFPDGLGLPYQSLAIIPADSPHTPGERDECILLSAHESIHQEGSGKEPRIR